MPTKKKTLKSYVTQDEYNEISSNAERTRLTLSTYIRKACLGCPLPTFERQKAVRELSVVAGDLGRLGGLLKLAILNEDKHQDNTRRILEDIMHIKEELSLKIMEL